MELISVMEGRTTIQVPVHDPGHPFPPGSAPVFYNPRMAINRDATVLTCAILNPHSYLDAMGATGLRGCRVGYETGIPVTINDRDQAAADLIAENVRKLDIAATVTCRDANALMSEERFGFVDLDPFGTPAPFIDAALKSAGKYLGITATDTAPLCGAHLRAGIRRYLARPLNTEYHSEVGLRILLGNAARHAAVYDRGVEPLFCFAREHFVRLHIRLKNGAGAADQGIRQLGYIHQCPVCPYRTEETAFFPTPRVCPVCEKPMQIAGPLWTGAIQDAGFMESAADLCRNRILAEQEPLARLIATCRDELPTSFFYNYHQVARWFRLSPGPIDHTISRLEEEGYVAGRVHYSGYGIKTTAPLEVLKECITAR